MYGSMLLNREKFFQYFINSGALFKQRDDASRTPYGEEKSPFLDLIDLQRIQKEKYLEMEIPAQNELNTYYGSLKCMRKLQYIDCSWINIKRVLQKVLRYKNGTKHIN